MADGIRLNRSQVFRKLDVIPTNVQWSWCAMHKDKAFAVFTVWEDRVVKGKTYFTSADPAILSRHGGRD